MKDNRLIPFLFVFWVIVLNNSIQAESQLQDNQDQRTSSLVGLTSAQIARLHGYRAVVHSIDSQPNVRINLVHIFNPAISKPSKIPVLFIHGIATSSSCFMVNAEGARPRDLSQYNAANMSEAELKSLLENDAAAKGLPFLFSNFGHDVWLMNRRPTLESQLLAPLSMRIKSKRIKSKNARNQNLLNSDGRIQTQTQDVDDDDDDDDVKPVQQGKSIPENVEPLKKAQDVNKFSLFESGPLIKIRNIIGETIKWSLNKQIADKTFNRQYWDYSMDEQAIFDLPAVIRFILQFTKWPKISIVGHSMGGAIPLMMLAEKPGIARRREY